MDWNIECVRDAEVLKIGSDDLILRFINTLRMARILT